jgi:hypothetical protein
MNKKVIAEIMTMATDMAKEKKGLYLLSQGRYFKIL